MNPAQSSGDDPRIAALREVAGDDCEYSGWVNLAQGALEVLAERDAEVKRLREILEVVTRWKDHWDQVEARRPEGPRSIGRYVRDELERLDG